MLWRILWEQNIMAGTRSQTLQRGGFRSVNAAVKVWKQMVEILGGWDFVATSNKSGNIFKYFEYNQAIS